KAAAISAPWQRLRIEGRGVSSTPGGRARPLAAVGVTDRGRERSRQRTQTARSVSLRYLRRKEQRMFASIRRYRLRQGPMDVLARRVDESFAEQISSQPGFASYEFIDCGGDEIITLSVF